MRVSRDSFPILSLVFFIALSSCARAPVKMEKGESLPQVKIDEETDRASIGDSQAYAHYLMGLIYDDRAEFEEAIGEYEKALRFDPHSSTILTSLGKDYLRRGMAGEAQKKLDQAAELDPDNGEAHLLLALICEMKKDAEGAAKHYEKALQLGFEDVSIYHRLGEIYYGKGRLEEAIEKYSSILKLDPSDPERNITLRLLLSAIYEEAGKLEEACGQLKEALKIDPDNDLTHLYLGANLDKQGRMEEAISEFKKAIQLNPKNVEALNYLGYLYADKGINLDESIQLIKTALEIEPESGYIVDSLGWAYFKKGMIEGALQELERAVELTKAEDKDDPIIRDHLGDAYLKKGMVREAIEQWEMSLELKPDNEEVKRKIERARESLEEFE